MLRGTSVALNKGVMKKVALSWVGILVLVLSLVIFPQTCVAGEEAEYLSPSGGTSALSSVEMIPLGEEEMSSLRGGHVSAVEKVVLEETRVILWDEVKEKSCTVIEISGGANTAVSTLSATYSK